MYFTCGSIQCNVNTGFIVTMFPSVLLSGVFELAYYPFNSLYYMTHGFRGRERGLEGSIRREGFMGGSLS